MSYIYLNFCDLSEEKQEELRALAREELRDEADEEEKTDADFDNLIEEQIWGKLASLSHQGRFVFNI